MKIAVEGCAHGELERIYECLETLQERECIKIDLLICCGDFQAVRNHDDLRSMAIPQKYYDMCSFYKYYSGEKKAPILTIFIGGNHEASNYLQELPYGGWVAPNIYYLGRAGVVKFGNMRIGGLSGIFKGRHYSLGLWECLPYDGNSLRSVYHVRTFDVFRLNQLQEEVNVMLSHDWPRGITKYGNREQLLKAKPFFREDIESNKLGSEAATKLLHSIQPDYWFSAHLHCKFAAIVNHEDTERETKFLALDKCLPKRSHLQILDMPLKYDGDKKLKYDVEWLAILKSTNHLLSVKNIHCHMPGPGGNERYDFTPTTAEKEAIINLFQDMIIPEDDFVRTAPIYNPNTPKLVPSNPIENPQTVKFCEKLGIDDPVQVIMARSGRTMTQPKFFEGLSLNNDVRIPDDVNFSPVETKTPIKSLKLSLPAPVTPSEADSEDTTITFISPSTSCISFDSTNTAECVTPQSAGPKKTFKRRNISIYTSPDVDDSVSTTSSSLLDSDSPKSCKLPCRQKTL